MQQLRDLSSKIIKVGYLQFHSIILLRSIHSKKTQAPFDFAQDDCATSKVVVILIPARREKNPVRMQDVFL